MLHTDSFNELNLLQQLSEDSETAFEKIYALYSKRLYCKLYKLLKSEVIAEEILQDVFLIIWDNRKKLDLEKSFCSYLFCIATNKCYDYFRTIVRDRNLHHKLIQAQQTNITVEESLINKEDSGMLHHAIELLPPKRQLVFRLCKVEGKTYEEVSHELGISLSTISDHIVKANLFIRTHLLSPAYNHNYTGSSLDP